MHHAVYLDHPTQLADVLSVFVGVTKQVVRCHVLLVTSELYHKALTTGWWGQWGHAFCQVQRYLSPWWARASALLPLVAPAPGRSLRLLLLLLLLLLTC
jgi:hypothetical protein